MTFKEGHNFGVRFKKGDMPWNKNLTKELDSRIKNNKKFNKKQTEEIISLYGKKSITQISKKFKCSASTILTILKGSNVNIKGASFFNIGKSSPMKGRKHTEEAKQKNREKHTTKEVIERLRKRNFEDNPSKRPEVREKLKVTRAKQILPVKDTKIELKIQNFLKQLGIEYFTHQYMKEIEHSYQCDVLIPSMNLVIECDGDYWHKYPIGREIDNIRTSELLSNGFKVLRLWECEIKVMDIKQFKWRLKNE